MKGRRMSRWVGLAALVVGVTAVGEAQMGRRQRVLDSNIASEKELLALPHLDAGLVRGILDRRPFLKMADLDAFLRSSLSDQQRTDLYRRMFVALNLNTASEQEILLIPGIGERMLGEFLEYRPYRVLAQFRREIGKYVDDEEVARLERCVTPARRNGGRQPGAGTLGGPYPFQER